MPYNYRMTATCSTVTTRKRVLVACEFSGIVRDAFSARGFDAWSCDLLPSERPGNHIIGDVLHRLFGWDLIIAHPPCTDLAVSGARWFVSKWSNGSIFRAIEFFLALANAPCQRVCVENPVGLMSRYFRKPDQIVQPWWFGHGETKATCLWLKNLPSLVATNIVPGRVARVHREPPGAERWKNRSRTYQGVADAMALQWGPLL